MRLSVTLTGNVTNKMTRVLVGFPKILIPLVADDQSYRRFVTTSTENNQLGIVQRYFYIVSTCLTEDQTTQVLRSRRYWCPTRGWDGINASCFLQTCCNERWWELRILFGPDCLLDERFTRVKLIRPVGNTFSDADGLRL